MTDADADAGAPDAAARGADLSAEPDLYDDLSGQAALVTGANRGIGAEIAGNLAELGATVYAGVRSVTYDLPDEYERVTLDVSQEGDIQDALNRIGESEDGLDILVNNAGVGHFGAALHEEQTHHLDHSISVNLRGPMLLCKYALPPMLNTESPRIVNVSSGMGTLGEEQSGGSPAYRVTKTGINGLTKYLHGEYAEEGLIANSVCPGWVHTELGGEEAPRTPAQGAETPTWLARFRDGPGGRFWRDREVIDW
ncbi:SDR family NAD(P)-dependent oxidoreductase [Halobaculum gomorrense]|uniref:NAD(P)-dependent dehydrogenase, short-chain alcohol dehydrogenase family n=1 Tax=Halobaculum gomorrense TaxID=43928 RepID=A0A1M5MC02_9EURY|nr:SDR family NAD(P)-dependent oxidoreductase [Halobaculum gomorrense]SHG74808.1 NAD(P)-dependent dehydrogenase, short-chain alcohol dehydrogenase family [Halobaculum gomorrense]